MYPSGPRRSAAATAAKEELERLFGLTPKVVIRWERGRVLQRKTADALLRLMDQNPDIVDELQEIHA